MLKESAAERMLCDWLRQEGYSPHKGVDVDQEAWKDGRLKWLFEVKGDQMNEQAKRLSFLTGLGQTLIAKSHAPGKKTSLVLTAQYDDLLWKYADVLLRERISVYLIEPHGEVSERRLATLRPSFRTTRQGHPDGDFGCGRARYRVTNGHITEYRLDSRAQPSKASFTSLCRDLGIRIGTDSAARVLSRRSTRLSRSGAKTPNLPLQADEASPRR